VIVRILAVALTAIVAISSVAVAETARFSVMFGGKNIGHLTAETNGDQTSIDYDYKNNGRGPTMTETIRLDPDGLPVAWTITGTTTFSAKVAEHFSRTGSAGRG
jgi:hypothetical protein